MASYHLSAKLISRSSGRSSIAAAAYRSAQRILDKRQGIEHDYANRTGVLHCDILLPPEAPDWMAERSLLWNAVEEIEKRKDAQLAREIVVALPHELSDDARRALVHGFAQQHFVARGMVADVALHAPGAEGDARNHHAHIMLTTRSLEADGFGKKERAWNSKDLLEDWRESWAEMSNAALERHGIEDRIDHRTLEAQRGEVLEQRDHALEQGRSDEAQELDLRAMELDRDPLPDIGWKAWGLERRGVPTALGEMFREAAARLEQVREVVRDLREGIGTVLERSGLAQALDRLRGSSLHSSAERGLEGVESRQGGKDRPEHHHAPEQGIAGALQRLQQSRAAVSEPAPRSRADQRIAAAERARQAEEEAQARQRAEQERQKQLELEKERQLELERERGLDLGM